MLSVHANRFVGARFSSHASAAHLAFNVI